MDINSFVTGFSMGKKKGGSGGGDIIDVPELPTENIEEGKIYRVVKGGESTGFVWLNLTNKASMAGEAGEILRAMGLKITFVYHIVDELPETLNSPLTDENGNNVTDAYILKDTGHAYLVEDDGDGAYLVAFSDLGVGDFKGIISDSSEAIEDGVYSIITSSESSTTYGIPDEANNKTVFEHTSAGGWAAVNTDIVDVPELPTENVDETKIYRVQSEVQETVTEIWDVLSEEEASMMGVPSVVENGEMWRTLAGMQGGFSVNYFCHIVDELPEVGELSMVVDQNAKTMTINIYVLKGDSESRAYCYAVNGGVGEWGEYDEIGSYRGTVTVNDVSELENLRLEGEGYYIVNRNATVMRTIYGIPNANPVKRLVDGAWVELT